MRAAMDNHENTQKPWLWTEAENNFIFDNNLLFRSKYDKNGSGKAKF